MATLNPLEQKARSSFWKGILITAFIAIIIIGLLAMYIFNLRGAEQERLNAQKDVVVLKQSVVSGQALESSMFEKKKVDAAYIPTGAASDVSSFMNLVLVDKDGNQITKMTKSDGTTYANRWIIDIRSEDNLSTSDINEGEHEVFVDIDGNYYYEVDGDGNSVLTDDQGNKYNLNNNRVQESNIQTKYIDLAETSYIAKIDLKANTVLTADMIVAINEEPTDDVREEEYNMIVLPSTLMTDDTVDIRLRLPTGQDYIVISKKKVTIPEIGDGLSTSTIIMNLNEGELLTMSSAIVDAYQLTGSKLYATKYVEPGLQESSTLTYTPSQRVIDQINTDPNIVNTAKAELYKFYGSNYDSTRGRIDEAISTIDSQTRRTNVESGTSSEASSQRTERQQYLESVSGE